MKINLLMALITALGVSACALVSSPPQQVVGSGVIVRAERAVSGFDSIEIASSAEVTVNFGEAEAVVIESDDNILPLIKTEVRGDTLVISAQPNTDIITKDNIHLAVTMRSLEAAAISGSGTISVTGLQGSVVKVELSGSGNIAVTGVADSVDITLSGSGNILCADLLTRSAVVRLEGSGNVTVFASESLDATITGSGTIHYSGSPSRLETAVPGSGSVNPLP